MKLIFSIILSSIIFTAGFQSSLLLVDYQLNRTFYEIYCINKSKPNTDCHGKCQIKKESEKSSNPFNLVKYSFEFNILPSKPFEFNIKTQEYLLFQKVNFSDKSYILSKGFSNILPHPPQIFI